MANTFTKTNFSEEVLQSDIPVMVDFWASWCMPCKMLTPVIEELAEEANGYKVGKVNVDEEPELARQYNVMSIPTVLIFKGGQVVNQSVGVQPKEVLEDMIQRA